MKIKIKLYAMLSQYLPADSSNNQFNIIIPKGETIQSLLDRLRLPGEMCHLVLINGHYVYPSNRTTQVLSDGDNLAIWPPIAGG